MSNKLLMLLIIAIAIIISVISLGFLLFLAIVPFTVLFFVIDKIKRSW